MRFLLLNQVTLASGATLRVAKELDDQAFDVGAIKAAGGVVVELPNVPLEARAVQIREQQARGRRHEEHGDLLSGAVADSTAVVVAHPDGSIRMDVDGMRIGEFADEHHGPRNGGNLHPPATREAAGFMSAKDKRRLDEVERVVALLAAQAGISMIRNTETDHE